MRDAPRYPMDRVAFGLCALVFLFWVGLLSFKYYSFGYYDWDLAMYAQVMWNLKHGSLYSSLMGMNFLGNHAEYVAFLLLPIYLIFSHPLTLVVLKILSHTVGAFVLYLWAKKNIPAAGALTIMILFLSFPANIFALLYEFHFESLNVGLLFLLFYFFQTQKFFPFCLTMIVTSLIKENMPPVIAAFGIYALFSKRRNKGRWSLVPIVWGAFIFCVAMLWITPLVRNSDGIHSANQYVGLYSSLGGTPIEIIKTFFFHPGKIFSVILQSSNIHYLTELFEPLLFLPCLSPHILFLALPIFLQHLLSSAPTNHTIFYHYAATLTPFVFLAAVQSLKFIYTKFKPLFYYILLSMLVLTCALNLRLSRENILSRISFFENRLTLPHWQMVQKIPKDAGVIASLSFLAELSQRKHVYSFLDVLRNTNGLSGQPFQLAPHVSYALIDFEDGWIKDEIFRSGNPKVALNRMQEFFKDRWSLEDAADDTILFKREEKNEDPLIERSSEPFFPLSESKSILIDDKILFLKCEIAQHRLKRSNVLPLTFYWKAKRSLNENYFMTIILKEKNRTIISKTRRIGYTIFPTSVWREGDYIKEHYWLLLPEKLPPGKYSLEINLWNKILKIAEISVR